MRGFGECGRGKNVLDPLFFLSLSLLLPSYDDPSRVGCYKVRASVGYILKISSQVWYGGLLGFKLIYIFFI